MTKPSMIERCAKAIYDEASTGGWVGDFQARRGTPERLTQIDGLVDLEAAVRAVIGELMEPSEGVLAPIEDEFAEREWAGQQMGYPREELKSAEDVWRAALHAVLDETP